MATHVLEAFKDVSTDYITLGADPEVFLADMKLNEFRSAIGLIGGTKEEPLSITENIAVQEDNVLCEYTIPPAKGKDDFIRFIREGVDVCASLAKQKGLDIVIVPSVNMPDYEINKNENSMIFGCEPDYSVYTLSVNCKPSAESLYNYQEKTHLRTAGGHVHIGYLENNRQYGFEVDNIALTKAMDLCLGVWSITQDNDAYRRKVYGQPGSFRMKEYGLEYRVLSNFWIKSEALIEEVYLRSLAAYRLAVQCKTYSIKLNRLNSLSAMSIDIIQKSNLDAVDEFNHLCREHLGVSII